jgi:hypothetical protein
MASAIDAPVDLYIATYPDPDAARGDWDTIKELAKDDTIKVDGLILVSRRADGKIHEERWEGDIDKALSNASNVTKEKVDPDSADQVKTAASKD